MISISFISNIIIYAIIGIILLVLIGLFSSLIDPSKSIRKTLYEKKMIPAEQFERYWIINRKYKQGFKYEDQPGCYIILIFNQPVQDNNYDAYENVYVGQSVHMFQRVHAHLNGKGNGDVYADRKFGKHIYLQFVKCDKSQLNEIEKKYIAAFHATDSYNATRGGSKKQ